MSRFAPPTEFPEGPGVTFDQLHEWFGFGYYDDLVTDVPWHKVRMGEIAKLKALLNSRRSTTKQVLIAGWFARSTGRPVAQMHDLFALIPEAMRAYNARQRDLDVGDRESAIADAIEAGELGWAERLARSTDPAVLNEWRSR